LPSDFKEALLDIFYSFALSFEYKDGMEEARCGENVLLASNVRR
jgi:hypothetical protein